MLYHITQQQDLIDIASDKDEVFFQVWTHCRNVSRRGPSGGTQTGLTMIELGRKKIVHFLNEILESYKGIQKQRDFKQQLKDNQQSGRAHFDPCEIETRYNDPQTELVIRPTTTWKKDQVSKSRLERNGLTSWITNLQAAQSLLIVAPSLLAPKAQSMITNSMLWRSNSATTISKGKRNDTITKKSKYRKGSIVPLSVVTSSNVGNNTRYKNQSPFTTNLSSPIRHHQKSTVVYSG
jgi:hypothetical protein